MLYSRTDAMDFIKENDVKFIRLAFCDIYGNQKNISIQPCELERAFDYGIGIDASSIQGFGDEGHSDLFLVPDASTMSVLPWRPAQGRVVRFFCNIRKPDGSDFELDSRKILSDAVRELLKHKINANFGAECEFYLFKTDENGEPTDKPFDNGGYLDMAPDDKGENVRREICLTLEEMGITPESSHHEGGPGQNEIDFKYSNPLTSADNVITFKSVVRTIAGRNGVWASFEPKPIANQPGSGFHINVSVRSMEDGKIDEKINNAFLSGVLTRVREMTLFLNPDALSYSRLGCARTPKYVSWAHQDRSQLIRIPASAKNDEIRRFEMRSPDCLANPYIAYALIIYAGLEGIEKDAVLPPESPHNMHTIPAELLDKYERLPENIGQAVQFASRSEFIRKHLPSMITDAYFAKTNMHTVRP